MHIYKIMLQENWEQSQKLGSIIPSSLDVKSNFMHICAEHQVQSIIDRFFSQERNIVIAKLDSTKLIGELVYESNHGGIEKYYHLYNGSVPLTAVVSTEFRTRTRVAPC